MGLGVLPESKKGLIIRRNKTYRNTFLLKKLVMFFCLAGDNLASLFLRVLIHKISIDVEVSFCSMYCDAISKLSWHAYVIHEQVVRHPCRYQGLHLWFLHELVISSFFSCFTILILINVICLVGYHTKFVRTWQFTLLSS